MIKVNIQVSWNWRAYNTPFPRPPAVSVATKLWPCTRWLAFVNPTETSRLGRGDELRNHLHYIDLWELFVGHFFIFELMVDVKESSPLWAMPLLSRWSWVRSYLQVPALSSCLTSSSMLGHCFLTAAEAELGWFPFVWILPNWYLYVTFH